MTEQEALKVYGLLAAAWPAWKATDATVDLWTVMLADLDYTATVAAVRAMVALEDGWPSVAKVRRQVAADAGLLAPDFDRAWTEVVTACRRSGRAGGKPSWSHRAITEAVDAIGWRSITDSDNLDVVRGQWRKAYEGAAERARTDACAVGGTIALPEHRNGILGQAPPGQLGAGHG